MSLNLIYNNVWNKVTSIGMTLNTILLQAWNTQTNTDLSLDGPIGQVYALVVGNDLLFAGTQVIFFFIVHGLSLKALLVLMFSPYTAPLFLMLESISSY